MKTSISKPVITAKSFNQGTMSGSDDTNPKNKDEKNGNDPKKIIHTYLRF
jgi:hypothetical protein